MKKPFLLLLLLWSVIISANPDLSPGIDRWTIKTTLVSDAHQKTMTLAALLKLKKPFTASEGISSNDPHYDDNRFTKTLNSTGLKEGDIVTTKGYLHLVALEKASDTKRDGDYHIQITNSAEWGDSCLVVEIPLPDFIDDPDLKQQVTIARQFVKEKLLKNKEPGTGGNKMQHEVYVQVKGALFFDLIHSSSTDARGKRGMKSYTCWEIHPVTDIKFAVKP